MAKTRRLKPYQIEVGGKFHTCSRAEWMDLIERGLAAPTLNGEGVPSQRLARLQLRRGLAAFTVQGRLQIVDLSDRAHWPTHAQMLDRQWIYSGNGASPLPPRLVREIRARYGPERWQEADAALRDLLRDRRQVLIREQFKF